MERKRHIGNDIVNIVFIDGGPTFMSQFNPTFIKSQFTRILFVYLSSFKKENAFLSLVLSKTIPIPSFRQKNNQKFPESRH